MKLNDEQLASLTNPKTLKEYIEHEKENITEVIKQNLAVGDIFKRENLQVKIFYWYIFGSLLLLPKLITLADGAKCRYQLMRWSRRLKTPLQNLRNISKSMMKSALNSRFTGFSLK